MFKAIRNTPKVYQFLTAVRSRLRVVLSVYNGDEHNIMRWSEFLS